MKKIEIIHHFINESAKGGIGMLAQHIEGDSFFTLTTAVCSTKDNYKKKTAVKMLVDQMESGASVRFPIDPELRHKMRHRDLRDHIIFMFAAQR